MRRTTIPTPTYVIRIDPVTGCTRPPLFWTGCGWTAMRGDAKRFLSAEEADQCLALMRKDWYLTPCIPPYNLDAGGKIGREQL